MANRAALVTGGSSGIGLAISRVLLDEGYDITMSARRAEKLARAAEDLRGGGGTVLDVAADLSTEQGVIDVVRAHEAEYGRLDMLVNNAGLGVGGPIDEVDSKYIDLQFALNLKAVFIAYRESLPMLRAAGSEHRNAWVVNMSSITGKRGHEWLSVYSAVKHGVVGLTEAMNKELKSEGIKSCVFCPAYVDTDLSEYKRAEIPPGEMITVEDVAGAVRYLTTISPNCLIPEIMFTRPGDTA